MKLTYFQLYVVSLSLCESGAPIFKPSCVRRPYRISLGNVLELVHVSHLHKIYISGNIYDSVISDVHCCIQGICPVAQPEEGTLQLVYQKSFFHVTFYTVQSQDRSYIFPF